MGRPLPSVTSARTDTEEPVIVKGEIAAMTD